MATVTTSIVIEFDSGDADVEYIFSAEVDSREDGLNNGNTNFKPGDPVYILLHRTDNTVVDGIITTHGVVNAAGNGTYAIEDQYAQFISDDNVTVNKPIHSGFSGRWLGNDLGTIQVLNQSKIKIATPPTDEHYVGVYKYDYTTDYESYVLQHNPFSDETSYQIIVYIYGHSI